MYGPGSENADLSAAWVRTHDRLRDMQEMAPGPTLLTALLAIRSEPIDVAGSLILTVLWNRMRAWTDAQTMIEVANTMDGAGELPGLARHEAAQLAAQEIADLTHVAYATAADTVVLTERVRDDLALSWEALNRGEWSLHHLKALAGATEHCSHRLTQAADAIIVPLATNRGWTPGTVGAETRKVLLRLDPDGAAERAAAKKKDADVTFYGEPDEIGSIIARGDVITARQIFDTLNARAAQMRQAGDTRSVGERRYGAMAEYILGDDTTTSDTASSDTSLDTSRDSGQSPAKPGPPISPETRRRCQELARQRGEALVRVDLATVLGDDNDPGELDGYGPISASTARAFAATAMWRRMVSDAISGELHHLDTTRYAPSNEIRQWVQTRDRICQHPGCRRPARRCQIDHRIPHGEPGGVTCICNLQPLCLMHHQFKTKKWYSVTIDQHGVSTWNSRFGFSHTNRRTESYDVPLLEPPDEPEYPEPVTPRRDLAPPDSDDPPPLEPPLDSFEMNQLIDALDRGWGTFSERAYNLLRAAQLID